MRRAMMTPGGSLRQRGRTTESLADGYRTSEIRNLTAAA